MSSDPNLSEIHLNPQSPLRPAIKAWEYYLQDQGRSTYTIKAFTGDLQLLVDFLPPDRTLGSVTTRELSQFTEWLQHGRNVPCSPKSLSRRVTSVKSFFRWLVKYGILTTDPAEKLLQQSVISPLPEVLTVAETEKLLETALQKRKSAKPDARPYTLLKLLLETAIKKGECLGIHLNHIDLESPDGPILFVRYASPSNRYKERKLPLSEDWVAACQEYLEQYKPVDQLFYWSPRRLEYLLEDLGKDAGLSKHVSFDMCRWTSVLNDYRSGLEHDKIRQKLGISKIQWREINMKLRQLSEAKP
ncbi:MAG: site-specific integrase [Anaerolineae bacterium]|nr:site-specific integrase [Anaerolineae bacterium]